MTSAEIKFIRRMAKYARQDYKTDEDILSELKIHPFVKKIKRTWGSLVVKALRY
jgi:hypothetical protein